MKLQSEDSQQLYQIARTFVELCPAELGQEIVVLGSVGWGYADFDSDVDIEFWVEKLPELEKIQNWLDKSGAENLLPEINEGINIICRFQDVWVEASWCEIRAKEKLLQAIAAGEGISRPHLVEAGNIVNGKVLRTSGIVTKWQQQLSEYPEGMQERIIKEMVSFWGFPHRVEMLWILAKREEVMGLTQWLMADIEDGLRILSAINRKWELDWKHLRRIEKELEIKPPQLIERVNQVFTASSLEERVMTTQRLILDILALVPESYDVSQAMSNIQECFDKHELRIKG